MRKKMIAIIALTAALLSCQPIAAEDTCPHDMSATNPDSITYGTVRYGCTIVKRMFWIEQCVDCGATFEHYEDLDEWTEHTTVSLRAETCDGVMHHQYYSCDCGDDNAEGAQWCNEDCPIYLGGGGASYNKVIFDNH